MLPTCIEYYSANSYDTYTMCNPADILWDVLNYIMSSYYLHIYWIFGLNGLVHLDDPTAPPPLPTHEPCALLCIWVDGIAFYEQCWLSLSQLFWLFCMPYSCTTSRFGCSMPMYHVCTIWVGLKRPGKSEPVTLLPCPHTYPHTLSPSYGILIHALLTISYLLHYWIPTTYHPPPCIPLFAFF